MRLSETCFVLNMKGSGEREKGEYSIRWFTPTNEVDLCGHATLAAAHVLFNHHHTNVSLSDITFVTKHNLRLTVSRISGRDQLSMTFPCYPPVPISRHSHDFASFQQLVLPILTTSTSSTKANKMEAENEVVSIHWSSETQKVIFFLSENVEMRHLKVCEEDFKRWMCLELSHPVRGVCLTKRTRGNRFQTRYFSPWNGIGEDPVNGSSHTVLAPLWRRIVDGDNEYDNEVEEDGGSVFHSEVCSPRGGELSVCVAHDNLNVQLRGGAVVVLSGQFNF